MMATTVATANASQHWHGSNTTTIETIPEPPMPCHLLPQSIISHEVLWERQGNHTQIQYYGASTPNHSAIV